MWRWILFTSQQLIIIVPLWREQSDHLAPSIYNSCSFQTPYLMCFSLTCLSSSLPPCSLPLLQVRLATGKTCSLKNRTVISKVSSSPRCRAALWSLCGRSRTKRWSRASEQIKLNTAELWNSLSSWKVFFILWDASQEDGLHQTVAEGTTSSNCRPQRCLTSMNFP